MNMFYLVRVVVSLFDTQQQEAERSSSLHIRKMCILTNLSKFVLLPVYCEWLDVTNLCLLDCAWCSSIDRDQFLQCIQHENVKFEGLCESTVLESYLQWLVLRKLHIKQLYISRVLVKKVQANCIACLSTISILKIEEDSHLYRKGFTILIKHCPNLLELYLSECRLLNDDVVKSIADNCKNLTKIHFPCIGNPQDRVSDQSVVHLANSCTQLQVIYLANFSALTDKAILSLIEHCPHISELSIINFLNITNNVLYSIAKHLPNLSLLDISNCMRLTSPGLFAVFGACKQLKHFVMKQNCFMQRNQLETPHWLELAKLSRLQTLRLGNPVLLTDADVIQIMETCVDLTTLDISYRTKRLTHPNQFAPPQQPSEAAYEYIARHCGNLTELHMPGPDKLPDSTMDLLILHGTKLRVVNFSHGSFSCDAIMLFIEKRGFNLREIYLRDIVQMGPMTNTLLEMLFFHCKKLEKLDISDNFVANYADLNAHEYLRLDEFITPNTTLKTLVIEGENTLQPHIEETTLEKLYAIKGLHVVE